MFTGLKSQVCYIGCSFAVSEPLENERQPWHSFLVGEASASLMQKGLVNLPWTSCKQFAKHDFELWILAQAGFEVGCGFVVST